MLDFNLLLTDAGIEPRSVAVVLHNTTLQPLRALMPSLWRERPDLFQAYQSVHGPRVEPTLRGRPNLASFVPLADRRMLFAGLFDCSRWDERPTSDIFADVRFDELERLYGVTDTTLVNNAHRPTQIWFDLRPLDALSDLRGRLVIATPPGRAYVRLAENLAAPILSLSETPVHEAPIPDWRDLRIPAEMLRTLPQSWCGTLTQWRGVYLIVDEVDGARYVGSAYGAENLLGRWRAHVAGEAGVTAELSQRRTDGFRFSILELTSPVAPPEDVIRLEQTWMERLHTRRFGLNAGASLLVERTGND